MKKEGHSLSLKNGNSFTIYPNPAKDGLFIESDNFQYNRIEIFDMTGRLVHSQKVIFEPKKRMELALPSGIYCLKIINNGKFYTSIFITE